MAPPRPPSGCWSCGALPSEEDIRLRAVLHSRSAEEGGPWTRLPCPSCGVQTALEEVPGGEPVLAPPSAAGIDMGLVATLLDGAAAREARRRARAWMERWGAALERLRRDRAAAPRRTPPPPRPPPPPPPPPRGGRGRGGRRAPPPPPGAPPPAGAPPLPRTPAEARAVLGVDGAAGAREIDAAFRKASRRCHPDLVSHLDEDFQRLAHGKFLRLKAAHDLLRGGRERPPPPPSSKPGEGRP